MHRAPGNLDHGWPDSRVHAERMRRGVSPAAAKPPRETSVAEVSDAPSGGPSDENQTKWCRINVIRRGPPRPARLARLAGWLPACFYCYCYYCCCCCLRSRGLPVLFVIKMAWVLLASTACHSAKAAAAENSVSPPISAPSRHARGRLWRRLRGLRPLPKRLPNLACWEPDRRNRRSGGFGGGRPPCLASANSRFITESRSRKPPAVAPVCVCARARPGRRPMSPSLTRTDASVPRVQNEAGYFSWFGTLPPFPANGSRRRAVAGSWRLFSDRQDLCTSASRKRAGARTGDPEVDEQLR